MEDLRIRGILGLSDATETCDVVILGFDASRDEPPEAGLQRVFGIDAASAGKLVANLPMTVQRGVPRVRAEYFRRALDGIGAQVEVRDEAGNPLEMLQPEEPTRSAAPPPRSQPPAGQSAATAETLDSDTLVDPTPAGLDLGRAGAALRATIAAETGAPVASGHTRPRDQITRPIAPTALDAPAPTPPEAPGNGVRGPAHPTVREGAPTAPERAPRAPHSDLPPPPGLEMPGWASSPPDRDDPAPPPRADAGDSTIFGGGQPATPELRRRYINDSAVYDPPPAAGGRAAGGGGAPTTRAAMGPAEWTRREDSPGPAAFPAGRPRSEGPDARRARPGAVAPTQQNDVPSDVWGSGDLPGLGDLDNFDDPSLPPPADAAAHSGGRSEPLRHHRAQHRKPGFDIGAKIPATAPVRAPDSEAEPSGLELDEAALPARRRRRGAAAPADGSGPRGHAQPAEEGPRGGRPRAAPRSASEGDPRDSHPPPPGPVRHVAAIGMAAAGAPPGAAGSSADTASFLTDTRNYWESFTDAFTTPFLGTGLYWVVTVAVWSIVVAAIGLLAGYMMIVGGIISFIANASLFAVTCDYFRAVFWASAMGESEVDRKPQFDPSVMLDLYFKQGLHLMFFMLLTQFLAVWWAGARIVSGTPVFDVLTDPVLWLLTLLPSFYWPAGVMMTAAHHEFGAIWNVPAGFRLILRAPLEYCTIVFTGLAIMVMTAVVFGALGHFLGATGGLLTGTMGLPLALSHGVMGALAGNLARARPDTLQD
jgi:hypothetical protein